MNHFLKETAKYPATLSVSVVPRIAFIATSGIPFCADVTEFPSHCRTLAEVVTAAAFASTRPAIKAFGAEPNQSSTFDETVTAAAFASTRPEINAFGVAVSHVTTFEETAVVIFTAGSAVQMPKSFFDSARTLAVHFYILAREGVSNQNAYATAAVLIIR